MWAEIERAIAEGDAKRVAALCLPLDEDERAQLRPQLEALVERTRRIRTHEQSQAIDTARFSVDPEPDGLYDTPPELIGALVLARPRAWRDVWSQHWLSEWSWGITWEMLRPMVRAGEVTMPRTHWFLLDALRRAADPAMLLREDPELLEAQAWAPFQAQRTSWSADHFEPWERAMVELAADGTISRERLVDETFAALGAEPDGATSRRLMAFHDRGLALTLEEQAARKDAYLRWLESGRDAYVGFALGHVARLERAGRLDDRELLDRLDGAVAVRAKSHARRAVTLVGRVLDRSPALASAAAPILAHALGHAAAEVQEAALTILERHPDAVGELSAETVDPSLRRRTLALVGEVPSTAAERVQVPPLRLPDPLGNDRIVPVEDVEELLDLAARLLEDDRDPDEFERLVDGVSRLCDVPVDEGRRTALLRRAKPRSSADCVEPLVQHWLAPDARSSAGWSGPADAVGRRLNALIARLDARRPALWLSAPTHRGGYIDPAVLADRLARADAIEDYDLAQALLRVPALQPLAGVGGEPGELIRAALAGEVRVPEAPALAASWDTAAVLAKPEALELAGPSEDAWEGVVHDLRAAPLSPARLLVAYASPYSEAALEGVAMQRRLSFVWPAQREVYFKTVWSAAWSSYGDPWGWGIVKFSHRLTAALEVMLDRGERLEPHALGLLAIGAQAPDENRLLATEVLIEAIEARRLPHTHFGRALAGTLDWPSAVPKRWADALEPVAGAGPLHAHEVRVVLEALFAALGERRPQLPGVIDLFRRLVVEQGAPVESEAARTWLGALSASSKSGKAARAALAVS